MRVLGIIPARAGSKRIADKNIKPLNNKPLIQYSIDSAIKASGIDKVIVSTDNPNYANLARSLGAEVPFNRPDELSNDSAPDKPVLQHALSWLKNYENYIPDAVAMLRPTSPFRSAHLINEVIEKFKLEQPDSIRTVSTAEGVHHPYWMYTMGENGEAVPLDKEKNADQFFQSQMLPPVYRLNGVLDIIACRVIENPSDSMYGDNMRLFETDPLVSMDIDTEYDFMICENLLKSGIVKIN